MTDSSPFQRLREERVRLGATQAAAAVGCGIERETWSRYEAGKRSPGLEVLVRFSALGADVRYVISGVRDYEPEPALTDEERVLISHFREASKDVRRAALGALLGAAHSTRTPVLHAPVAQRFGTGTPRGFTMNAPPEPKRRK